MRESLPVYRVLSSPASDMPVPCAARGYIHGISYGVRAGTGLRTVRLRLRAPPPAPAPPHTHAAAQFSPASGLTYKNLYRTHSDVHPHAAIEAMPPAG